MKYKSAEAPPTDGDYITAGTSAMYIGGLSDYGVVGFRAEYIKVRSSYGGTKARSFRDLAQEWKRETMGVSSVSEIVMHPAYQLIIGMGEQALSDILQDLQKSGGEWFHALHYIVGRDIAAGTETVSDATAAWIQWGYENNYI